MKKVIAVISGGESSEYVISVKSAEQIMNLIDQNRFVVFNLVLRDGKWVAYSNDKKNFNVDLNDFSIIAENKKIRIDFAYIIIHGTPGEDGKIQAYLEMMNIPKNTGNMLNNAICFNKYTCKLFLKNFDILTPESFLLRSSKEINTDEILRHTGLPCFIKPNNGGSSFGISKVNKQEEVEAAIQLAFKEDSEVIIESFVKGTELSCAVLKTKDEEFLFPVTEIVSKNDFFDFEAKYQGKADEITPARIDEDLEKRCKEMASEIYDHLNCKGIVRIDFIVRGNQLYFLEINTIPGMSKESIVPQQIRAAGYSEEFIINKIIIDSLDS